MRSFLAFVFGVCAVLATLVTMPAEWVSNNIADENGYVAFAEPIGRDSQFHGALADALSETLAQRAQLPSAAQPAAKAAIVRVANKVSGEPGFVAAWNDTQRQSHKIMLGDPRDLPPELDSSPSFAIDLGPLGKFIIDQANKDLPFTISAPDQAVIAVNGAPQADTLDRIRATPTYARNGLIDARSLGRAGSRLRPTQKYCHCLAGSRRNPGGRGAQGGRVRRGAGDPESQYGAVTVRQGVAGCVRRTRQ